MVRLQDVRALRVLIVTPAPRGSRKGNRITALRWAGHLRRLGHRVRVTTSWTPGAPPCDLVVALHALRSADSVERIRAVHADLPIIVAMTGTDLYRDIHEHEAARRTLAIADRLIVLQPAGVEELPLEHRDKTVVIRQSVPDLLASDEPEGDAFDVVVIGHLRDVKDPFLIEEASRLLPEDSRIRIRHIGEALDEEHAERARELDATSRRWRWNGPLPRRATLRQLASSRLLVVTSRMEGGANVVSEAIAADVPVLSTYISGTRGILGDDHPGYFPVGDAAALAGLLERAEHDAAFLDELRERGRAIRDLHRPDREQAAWEQLIGEFEGRSGRKP